MQRKLKLAYFSPMPPARSGIATYSHNLVNALAGRCEVSVFVSGDCNWEAPSGCCVINYAADPMRLKSLEGYDQIVYHLGNNPWFHLNMYRAFLHWPGFVVLHDFVLYYLMAGFGLGGIAKAIFENYGPERAAEAWKLSRSCPDSNILRYRDPARFPCLRGVLEQARGVIVHNRTAAERLSAAGYNTGVHVIPLLHYGNQDPDSIDVREIRRLREDIGVREDEILLGIFGFIGPTKRIEQILRAVRLLLDATPTLRLKILIVGEGEKIQRDIEACRLRERVISLGFVSDEGFAARLASVDIFLNLRYPSMGETSASLIQAMAFGKPSIVTNHGAFSELPDDAVIKVGYGAEEIVEIAKAIEALIRDSKKRESLGASARSYVLRNCGEEAVAESYVRILSADKRKQAQAGVATMLPRGSLASGAVRVVENDIYQALKSPLRLLVIKLDHRGDLALAGPAMQQLAKRFPGAEIDVLVGSWNIDICKEIFDFKRIVSLDFFKAHSDLKPTSDDARLRSVLEGLPKYHVAVDLRRSPDTRFVLDAVKSDLKIGYATGTEIDQRIDVCLPQEDDRYEIGMRKQKNEVSSAVQMIALVNAIPIYVNSWRRQPADSGRSVVAVFPGAGQPIKQWPSEYFVRLVDLMLTVDRIDCVEVFLFGDERAAPFLEMAGDQPKLRVFEGLSTGETLNRVGSASLVIGNNSFGAHIGSLFGIPTLAIFGGPEWWEEWQPVGCAARILYSDVECFPCHLDRIERCPHGHRCLRDISPEVVFENVREMIGDEGRMRGSADSYVVRGSRFAGA
jgi:ADP-heptose:LPS heptosyltransferase/glycosyltransferase involved in cell wall biosynthesis